VLEIVGTGVSKQFTMNELKQLPVTEGQAGIKSSTGKITPPVEFRGVALKDLANLLGNIDESMGINIVAEDGYAITFSYDQITNGTFTAYDPATGEELKGTVELTAILAYEQDGKPLDETKDGKLRVVIVSQENNQVTDGHWSVKWVNKVEIKSLVQDWTLLLHGAIEEKIDRASFESCVQCHSASWTDDQAQEWVGIPLWLLVGFVDDEVKHEGPAFNDDLAGTGYTFDVIAIDGYTVSFDIGRVARNDEMIVVYQVNGNPLPEKHFPLRLVGNGMQKNEQVGAIAEIDLHLEAAEGTAEPTTEATDTSGGGIASGTDQLVITGMVEEELTLTEADLRAMEVVQITAEHPKKGQEQYEGVRLSDLLDLAKVKEDATKLVFTAVDGFSAEVDLTEVMDCADCLLGFTNTPGKFKMVMPGLSSNLWVKDVVIIEVK
jgi:DMSO/TMAO reductase YedYZ molybdopterin-dependent catalytic subunit